MSSISEILRQITRASRHTHSEKSGNAGWAGQGRRRQSGYNYTNKRASTKDHLDELLVKDVRLAEIGSCVGEDGAKLETRGGRSCRSCTLEQTDLYLGGQLLQ